MRIVTWQLVYMKLFSRDLNLDSCSLFLILRELNYIYGVTTTSRVSGGVANIFEATSYIFYIVVAASTPFPFLCWHVASIDLLEMFLRNWLQYSGRWCKKSAIDLIVVVDERSYDWGHLCWRKTCKTNWVEE